MYQKEMHWQYAAPIRLAEEMLAQEKAWIKQNQGKDGEIYLNHTHDEAAGDVNPYFACQAAMGLLAGEPSEGDLAAVEDYLTWHTGELLRGQGEITNYCLTEVGLESTGKRDSVDAYLAAYLILLAEYDKKGGDVDAIPKKDAALSLCAEKLQDLIRDGLTQVSSTNGTRYLMDNTEVAEACRAAAQMLDNQGWETLRGKYLALANQIETSITEQLWQPEAGVYCIGLDSAGKTIGFSGWDKVYPDALAQLFPVICGVQAPAEQSARALYQAFCNAFRWEALELGDTRFPWACISYAAALQGDYTRAEQYLASFQERYRDSRSYPFHVAEAGWACRTWGGLLEYYQEQQRASLSAWLAQKIRGLLHE